MDRSQRVGGYELWWVVVVAEVSDRRDAGAACQVYLKLKWKQRYLHNRTKNSVLITQSSRFKDLLKAIEKLL